MNAYRHPVRSIAWGICAAALLYSSAGVSAQTVHKQIDAAGHVTFSDRSDGTPSPPTAAVPALDVASALARNSAMSSRRAAMIDANEAMRRLGQAELERKEGAERLPGERIIHGADANHRYQLRQEELRRAVAQAQRRSGETSRALRVPL